VDARAQAAELADAFLAELRKLSYGQCRELMRGAPAKEVVGSGGKTYQLRAEAFWDSKPDRNIRVSVTASWGGLSDFKPLLRDFIIAPDGSFVGEE
jgi:hypothetical protein